MFICFQIIRWKDYWIQRNPFYYREVNIYDKKEELFVFVNHHQEELEALLEEMKGAYEAGGEETVYLCDRTWKEYSGVFPVAETFIRAYPLYSISASEKDDSDGEKSLVMRIPFKQTNDFILGDDYWGIYYVETGRPLSHSHSAELAESGGIYYSTYGCIYETEHITGNWYYYRERW